MATGSAPAVASAPVVASPAAGTDLESQSGEQVASLPATRPAATVEGATPAAEEAARASKGPQILFAGLRGDGVLMPFAAMGNPPARWIEPWLLPNAPQSATYEEGRNFWIHDLGKSELTWALASDRPVAETARSSSVVNVETECTQTLGLATNVQPVESKEKAGTFIGAALTGSLAVSSPFRSVPADSDIARKIQASLATRFGRWESEAVDGSGPAPGAAQAQGGESAPKGRAALTLEARERIPVILEGLWCDDAGTNENRFCHLTAWRRYAGSAREGGCPDESLFEGWVVLGGAQPEWLDYRVTPVDCDEKEINTDVPLGIFFNEEWTVVVTVEYGYESQSLVVLELGGGSVTTAMRVYLGSC